MSRVMREGRSAPGCHWKACAQGVELFGLKSGPHSPAGATLFPGASQTEIVCGKGPPGGIAGVNWLVTLANLRTLILFQRAMFDPLRAQLISLAMELARLASSERVDTTSPQPSGHWSHPW